MSKQSKMSTEAPTECFDWLVDYAEIRELIAEAIAKTSTDVKNALVLGAGTSGLSEALVNDGAVTSVLSLDLEQHCVDIMSDKHRDDKRMEWAVADVTDWASVKSATQNRSFDLVVDKGTLDALLCVGDCASYLATIARTTRCGGAVVLVSLHGPEFVDKLLDLKTQWSRPVNSTWTRAIQPTFVSHDQASQAEATDSSESRNKDFPANEEMLDGPEGATRSFHATLFSNGCGKLPCECVEDAVADFDVQEVSKHLENVLEWYHQEACPFLSVEREASIRTAFSEALNQENGECLMQPEERLPLKQVYEALFTPEEQSCYTFDLFEEDATASKQLRKETQKMSFTEAITFLRINQ